MATHTDIHTAITDALPGTAKQWRWYHGLAFYVVTQLLVFGFSGLTSLVSGNAGKGKAGREIFFGNPAYFSSLKQSVVAPPSWVFGPVWTINNFFQISGDLAVLNKPAGTPGRNAYLALQGATWLDFVLFNAGYFSLRSPINAFVLTLIFFALTIASGFVAIFRLKDTKVALSLATLFVWLIIASTAATFQMLWNRDDFYKVGPFLKPIPGLVAHRD